MPCRFLLPLLLVLSCAYAAHLQPPAARSVGGFCLESDGWPIGPGTQLAPQVPQRELTTMLAQIDEQRINETITSLVAFGTRNTLSTQTDPVRGIGAARDWLAARMRNLTASAAHASVSVPSYIQQPASAIPFAVNISNVVTTITGADEPERVYIITGHYDSRNTNVDDFEADAPGADDDASGVAVVLELVRIFSQRPPPRATMMLAAVAGEEQGLYGSTFFAGQMKAAGIDVQGMFTNDIVGASKSDQGVVDAHSIRLYAPGIPSSDSLAQVQTVLGLGGENDSPSRELSRFTKDVAENSATDMSVRIIYRSDRFLRGGDHQPFVAQGFPAARFTEPNENFAHQHQDVRVESGVQFGDLVEFCDFAFNARVARVNMAAIWSLAQAPGTPKNVSLVTGSLTNNSTLKWDIDPSPTVAAYEVVWRATDEALWSNVVPVGLVGQATVDLSKDNALFGVRAVGTNGYHSPVAFPSTRVAS
ncbi:Zn-dependent exopeptidase [Vararia minispora EC-137]|uniref:Zn-dependent exopeptidase n=1 Tax=Vararia minispora EC-137 TaxID=1314806 RepID=A0ACB8QCK0_9AGAM|nr:Zn-dependent exopeptidase [Vararia minispora EC-137]